MANSLISLSEAAHESGGADPLVVGIGMFILLVGLLLALVAFGGGREHS